MMDSVKVTVELPSDLARDAREFDLLTEAVITQLLREAVDRRVNDLVNEEIHTYRREKRANSNPHR